MACSNLGTAGVTGAILHQAGAIAYRIVAGEVRVLLMTSRETGRWIIPKGNIDSGSAPCAAAEQEAYEEAGVRGVVRSTPTVEVYLLRVTERLKKWPEKGERRLSWVSIDAAIGLVEEPGIAPLLQRLAEFEENLRPEQARPARRCSAAPGG